MSPDEVGPPGTTPGGTDTNTSSHQETDTGQFTDGDGAGEGWEGYLRYTNPDDGGHISPEHLAMLAERAISAEFAWNR